jgi:hypothetical protein
VKTNISQAWGNFDAIRTRVIKSGQSVVDTISLPFSSKAQDEPVAQPELVSIVEEIKESETISDDNVYLLNSKVG